MEKRGFNIFDLVRNFVYFLKIVTLIFIILHLLYWVQRLIGSSWAWMNFAHPVLNAFLDSGKKITDGSLLIAGTLFEYKYIIALGLYIVVYFMLNGVINFINELENSCDDVNRFVKQKKEERFNKMLTVQQKKEQSQKNKYKVLIKTKLKKKNIYSASAVNMEEQNRIMNKFLMEQTGVNPESFEDGFLYSFGNFNNVDATLDILFKLIKSEAPLDYLICVHVFNDNTEESMDALKQLSGLDIINKISVLSDTAYRYGFNPNQRYKTVQIGLYQRGSNTIEVCEFVEI